MEYKINPLVYSNMFSLPAAIVDHHIRMAGTLQLRVILWLFRHAAEMPVSSKDMAKALGLVQSEIDDAMQYWVDCGIVNSDISAENEVVYSSEPETEAAPQPAIEIAPKKNEKEPEPVKTVEKIYTSMPTHAEIAQRLTQSHTIREIAQSTEARLGYMSNNILGTLISLHDDYGLSAPVIALAVEYACQQGKATPARIGAIGRKWCEDEIDTIEKVEEYMENHGKVDEVWKLMREELEIKNPSLTKKQREFLESWVLTMHFSLRMILLAYEQMADHTDSFSFPYMNKILVRWHKEGLDTPEKVAKANAKYSEKNLSSAKKKSKSSDASYDIDQFSRSVYSDPMDILNRRRDGNNGV